MAKNAVCHFELDLWLECLCVCLYACAVVVVLFLFFGWWYHAQSSDSTHYVSHDIMIFFAEIRRQFFRLPPLSPKINFAVFGHLIVANTKKTTTSNLLRKIHAASTQINRLLCTMPLTMKKKILVFGCHNEESHTQKKERRSRSSVCVCFFFLPSLVLLDIYSI